MSAATLPTIGAARTSTPSITVDQSCPVGRLVRRAGSLYGGIQGGYNYVFPSRLLLGAEVDFVPEFSNFHRRRSFYRRRHGALFADPRRDSTRSCYIATVRGRFGYAPDTGCSTGPADSPGLDQPSLTQLASGNERHAFLWRLGWAPVPAPSTDLTALDGAVRISFHRLTASAARVFRRRHRSIPIFRCKSCASG